MPPEHIGMVINVSNIYTKARERFEQQQKELFGCNYMDGHCTVHISTKKEAYETLGERNSDDIRGQRLLDNSTKETVFSLVEKKKTKRGEKTSKHKMSSNESAERNTMRTAKRTSRSTSKRDDNKTLEINYD